MNVAVIGTGNSGCALSAKLVENGHQVRLIKTSKSIHEENFETICQQKGVYYYNRYLDDTTLHFSPIEVITRNITQGITGADVVLVLTQSLQHQDIAKRVAPLLKSGQVVLLIPGNMGSLYFQNFCSVKDIIYAEGESTPYDARITKPGTVDILFKNTRNAIAFCPGHEISGLTIIDALWDAHKYTRTNIVESAMHNPNLVVHTIGNIMSASRIELMHGEFWMYQESFSPSIWHLIDDLDKEKNAVISAYGGKPMKYVEACQWRNENDLSGDPYAAFKHYAVTGGPKGPADLNSRYIHEDVPMGLCLLESLAQKANITTPITTSLINIASSLVQKDFRTQGRTLRDLGLNTLSIEQIKQKIN